MTSLVHEQERVAKAVTEELKARGLTVMDLKQKKSGLNAEITLVKRVKPSELTVMKACGISLYRIAFPVIGLSLVGSLALFALELLLAGARDSHQALQPLRPDRNHQPAALRDGRLEQSGAGPLHRVTPLDAQLDLGVDRVEHPPRRHR